MTLIIFNYSLPPWTVVGACTTGSHVVGGQGWLPDPYQEPVATWGRGCDVTLLWSNKGDSRPRHLQGKGLVWLDKLGVCLSLALCNLANFDPL